MKKVFIAGLMLITMVQFAFAFEWETTIKGYNSNTEKPGSVSVRTVRGGDPGVQGTESRTIRLRDKIVTLEVKNNYDECMTNIEISPLYRFASYRLYSPHSDTGIEQAIVCQHLNSGKTTVFYGFDLLAKHLKIDLTEKYDISKLDVRISHRYWSQNNSLIIVLEGRNPIDNKVLDLWFEIIFISE